MKTMKLPRGNLRMDGHPVKAMTRMPDGRYAIAREGAETVLVPARELPERIEVVL